MQHKCSGKRLTSEVVPTGYFNYEKMSDHQIIRQSRYSEKKKNIAASMVQALLVKQYGTAAHNPRNVLFRIFQFNY